MTTPLLPFTVEIPNERPDVKGAQIFVVVRDARARMALLTAVELEKYALNALRHFSVVTFSSDIQERRNIRARLLRRYKNARWYRIHKYRAAIASR